MPVGVIDILTDELFVADTVLNCKSLASLAYPLYVVEVILARVAELYDGIPNSMPDTWLTPFVFVSILINSPLGCIICSFFIGSVVPIPTFPNV